MAFRSRGVLLLSICAGAYAQNSTAPEQVIDPAWAEYDASFAQFLPPIFRVILMMALGIAGFGADLHILQRWGMNLWNASGPTRLPLHRATLDPVSLRDAAKESGGQALYILSAAHIAWVFVCWALYRLSIDPLGGGRTLIAQGWEVVALLGLVALWMIPGPFWAVQRALMRYVLRLTQPRIAPIHTVAAADDPVFRRDCGGYPHVFCQGPRRRLALARHSLVLGVWHCGRRARALGTAVEHRSPAAHQPALPDSLSPVLVGIPHFLAARAPDALDAVTIQCAQVRICLSCNLAERLAAQDS